MSNWQPMSLLWPIRDQTAALRLLPSSHFSQNWLQQQLESLGSHSRLWLPLLASAPRGRVIQGAQDEHGACRAAEDRGGGDRSCVHCEAALGVIGTKWCGGGGWRGAPVQGAMAQLDAAYGVCSLSAAWKFDSPGLVRSASLCFIWHFACVRQVQFIYWTKINLLHTVCVAASWCIRHWPNQREEIMSGFLWEEWKRL